LIALSSKSSNPSSLKEMYSERRISPNIRILISFHVGIMFLSSWKNYITRLQRQRVLEFFRYERYEEGRKGDVTRQWLIPYHRLHKIYARQILPTTWRAILTHTSSSVSGI
jgi:hypothetical protein